MLAFSAGNPDFLHVNPKPTLSCIKQKALPQGKTAYIKGIKYPLKTEQRIWKRSSRILANLNLQKLAVQALGQLVSFS